MSNKKLENIPLWEDKPPLSYDEYHPYKIDRRNNQKKYEKDYKNLSEINVKNIEKQAMSGELLSQIEMAFISYLSDYLYDADKIIYWSKLASEKRSYLKTDMIYKMTTIFNFKSFHMSPDSYQESVFLWYEIGAEKGLRDCQYELADFLYLEWKQGQRDFDEKIIKWMHESAIKGEPKAQVSLGLFFLNGEGVRKNNDLAFFWIKRASSKNQEAKALLGNFYDQGIGVTKDINKAILYKEKAHDWIGLVNIYRSNPSIKISFNNKISKVLESELIKRNLDVSYFLGEAFFKANFVDEALGLWDLCSSDDHIEASLYLGQLYAGFANTKKPIFLDLEKAKKYLYVAAAQDHPEAQYELGLIYYNEGDFKNAVSWWKQAGETCDPTIRYKEYDHPEACYRLGLMYYEGVGVKKDLNQTQNWWEKGKYLKSENCEKALKKLSLNHNNKTKLIKFPINSSTKADLYYKDLDQNGSMSDKLHSFAKAQKLIRKGVDDLIEDEESQSLEFKTHFQTPFIEKEQAKDPFEMRHDKDGNEYWNFRDRNKTIRLKKLADIFELHQLRSLRPIVAMLNQKGGNIVFGVHERGEKKTKIGLLGKERLPKGRQTQFFKNMDELTNHVREIVDNHLGNFKQYYEIYSDTCKEDKSYIIIKVTPLLKYQKFDDIPIIKDFKIVEETIQYVETTYSREDKSDRKFEGSKELNRFFEDKIKFNNIMRQVYNYI